MNIRRTLVSLATAAFVLAGCSEASQAPLAPTAPDHALAGSIDISGLLSFVGTPNLTQPRHAEKFITAA